MTETIYQKMAHLVEGNLDVESKKAFLDEVNSNVELAQTWCTFLIEQYLSRELNEKWNSRVDELINDSLQYKSEHARQKELFPLLRQSLSDDLKEEVKNHLPKKDISPVGTKFFTIRRMFTAVAAVILIVVVAVFVFRNNTKITNSELFAEHFEPYPMLLTQREGDQSETLKMAIATYESEDYSSAFTLFDSLTKTERSNYFYKLYAGESALADGQTATARDYFESLLTNDRFKELAEWQIVLTYLYDENSKSVKNNVNKIIANPDHDYYQNGIKLEKQLFNE